MSRLTKAKAVELAEHIVNTFTGEPMEIPMTYRLALGVRNNVYRMLTEKGKRGTISMVAKEHSLFVFAPKKSFGQRATELLQETLVDVKDEDLYNRVMILLEESFAKT